VIGTGINNTVYISIPIPLSDLPCQYYHLLGDTHITLTITMAACLLPSTVQQNILFITMANMEIFYV